MSVKSPIWMAWACLAAAGLSGCALSRETGSLSLPKLPSPWATVKASEKAKPGPATAAQRLPKKSATASVADGSESLQMAIMRGRNLERANDFDKARAVYEELQKSYPENPQVAHRLGVVADVQRRHAEAEHYFLIALHHDPRNAEILADLGYCYFLQGQLGKSESALTKAVVLEPGNSRYRNNLGLVLGHLGRHGEALAHFRQANSEADAFYNLAFIYSAQERIDEARECFEMALNADPTHRASREALASFTEYESLPPHLRDLDTVADSGVRWVPYVEGAGDDAGGVAHAIAPIPTSREASQVARALHTESRGMLNRNMQSQRNAEPGADAGR